VRILRLRWWFENRETGAITVAQFPNWPLFAIGVGWLVGRVVDEGSRPHDVAGAAVTVLWLYWAADEVLRGVNPWRRLVGALVIVWQAGRVLG
jgi:hypothetical protein